MPHIRIYSINYWPEETGIGPYSTGLAEHLAASGAAVTVVTGMPHYPAWKVSPSYEGRWRQTEHRNGVTIRRRRHHVPGRQSAVRRALYEVSFLMHAGMAPSGPPADAILGIIPSLTGGILARLSAARDRAAYGIVVQDLISAAAAQSGISGGNRVAALTGMIERWVLARATCVAPVAAAFSPALEAMGVEAGRISYLPNWTHLPPARRPREDVRRELGWDDNEVVALHAGNMGLKQGLDQVLEAARTAERVDRRLRFVLMGNGSQRSHLELSAKGQPNITFAPFVERDQLIDVLGAADVLLLSERPSVHDMSMPSKLTSYFAAGRPVVAAVDPSGASAAEVRRAGGGVVTPGGNATALVEAIIDLDRDRDEMRRLGENNRRYAETALGSAASLSRASEIVERLLERTTARRVDPSV